MQNKKKANWGSLARLLRFLWQDYKLSLSIAFVLIVVASLATVNLTASIPVSYTHLTLPTIA